MAQASTHSSNAYSVLSPMDKDSVSVPEGDASAQTQADPTSKKTSNETPVHNAQALNDIIESAPANDATQYFIHINGIKGLGTIATNPELATPAPYEQTPVRIHNQFMKQGTISPCDVALIETGSALANACTTSKHLAHSEQLAALIPNNVYQSCDPNDIEWNQLVCLKLHQITAKDIERARALVKTHKRKKGAGPNQAKHQLHMFLTLGVGAWCHTYIKLKQIKSCRKDDVIIVLPIAALKLANKTITAVKEQHPELLTQPWNAEVEARLYQEYQKLEANQATPQGEAEVRSRRVPQTGQFGRYDPQISAAQGIGVCLAASCALIEDVCAYYQPDSAMPVTVQSSAASPKTDQKSDAAVTNDQGGSENEVSQQTSELQDVADVNLELNIKKRLAFRFSISLPADYLKRKEKRQQAIINHSYNHDTKRAEVYCQQLFDGALAYYKRKVNAQLVPLKAPTEVQLDEDALPYMVVLGLMLSAQCADLVATLPVFKELAPKTERVLNEHKAQKKKAQKNKAKDDSAPNATSIDTSIVPDFAQADGAKFNQIRDMLQSGCVELLGRLNQLYEPLVPCSGLNREIMAAHDLLRQWQQPLEAKLEQQQDATKPIHNAASLKASFSAQLLRIEAEAHKLPLAMQRPICAVVKLLAALPLEREELLSIDALRTLTLGFLELTHNLSCDPLLQLQAPAQAEALSVAARSLEYMRARAQAWLLCHEPSQILDFALNLSTDCQREIQLLVHPYYEPQGQCLPAWSKQVFKALSKSELLLQKLAMLDQHASKDKQTSVVSAANSLLDLCRNAYQQASQQPDIAPHLLTQLAALYEQATQVLAPLQQDQIQLSQVVTLCAQLYALGQELQRKLARKDEPCALITSLDTTCYLSQLVTHNLKWASTSEQQKTMLLGLQPQVEHTITKLERVTKGALSSELNAGLNKCYQQCVQVKNTLSTTPSEPSADITPLTSVLEQLKQQYDELLDIIDPARTQDAGMTVLDKRDAQTQAQAYWLCSQVRACCSHLAQLQAFCAQLSPDDELKLAQLAVTAPEPTEGGQPSDKSAVPLLNAINTLLSLSTVIAPEQLEALAPPLEQVKAAWLNLKSQTDVLTALKALRLGCTELESIAAQLKQSLPEQRSFKLQAVRNLHLKRLEQLFAPLVGSADLKLKQELAQVLLTEVSSIEHDLGRTQLSATLAALYEHLVMLTQGRTNYQIERQIDELLQHMVRHASDLLGEHSDQPNFEHAAALEQDFTLFYARHLARTGYHCYQITTELRALYQDHPKMFGPAIWEQPLQELLNAAELSSTFELWAHKGQAQYQLHLAEALTLYQQARPLKEMFLDQVKHFDRVRKNCQHKVDACRKELKQAQGKQNQAKQEKAKQKKKAKVVALEQKLEQLEVKLKQAEHDYALIKPLLDRVAAIESESYSRFQQLYNAMSWQKVKLIDFVGERQGSELTDILSFKCALFTVSECQRVLKESKQKAEKKILGLIKDPNKARGKQRSAFVALRDYLHVRAKWLVKARWNPVEFAKLRNKYRQKHHLIVEVPADPTPTKNKNKSAAKQAVSTRKLSSRAPSSDRLNYASYTTEYRNPKNCCAFTSQLGGKGTCLKFTLPTNAKEIIQGTFHGKALGADGLFHNISCELDLGNKKHPDLVWQKLKDKNGEINLQNIKIVYQTLHTNNGRLCKRLAVYSCIPGQPENLSNKVEQIFEVLNNKANGVKRKNNKVNGVESNKDKAKGNNKNAGKEAWLKRVVALDLSLQTVAVLSFDGEKFTLLYEDFLQLNTKRRVQQWKSLLRKKEQDQRAYSKYMAKINPRFYDAHDRRLSNAEVYAKFGYIKEWHDNKALRLLNVLREDNRKIAQFRHDAHLKLIYKLLPLGGIVITEQMNYHSLAECARINPLQNGGERNSAAMQREMHQVQFDQEDLSLQTHHRSNKSAQSATSGTSSHRVTGTYAKNQESARDKASAKSASVKSQTTAATLNRAQRRTSGAPVQSNKTNQSKAERMPAQKRSRFGAAIGRAAPASFIQTYKTILAKQGGILVEAPTQLLKATQRNPLLEATPQAFNKLEGGLKQRYKQVLVPSAVNGFDHDIKVWVQRDFMAAFTLLHAVYNEKLIPDKGKTKRRKSDKSKSKVLNDVDVATCRADWAAFMKAYYYTMKHLRDKGLCPDLVKETLRPSKHDLKDHDWRWGMRAWLQIKKTRA